MLCGHASDGWAPGAGPSQSWPNAWGLIAPESPNGCGLPLRHTGSPGSRGSRAEKSPSGSSPGSREKKPNNKKGPLREDGGGTRPRKQSHIESGPAAWSPPGASRGSPTARGWWLPELAEIGAARVGRKAVPEQWAPHLDIEAQAVRCKRQILSNPGGRFKQVYWDGVGLSPGTVVGAL